LVLRYARAHGARREPLGPPSEKAAEGNGVPQSPRDTSGLKTAAAGWRGVCDTEMRSSGCETRRCSAHCRPAAASIGVWPFHTARWVSHHSGGDLGHLANRMSIQGILMDTPSRHGGSSRTQQRQRWVCIQVVASFGGVTTQDIVGAQVDLITTSVVCERAEVELAWVWEAFCGWRLAQSGMGGLSATLKWAQVRGGALSARAGHGFSTEPVRLSFRKQVPKGVGLLSR